MFKPDLFDPADITVHENGTVEHALVEFISTANEELDGHVNIGAVAKASGCALRVVYLSEDSEELYRRYEDGDSGVLRDWHPSARPGEVMICKAEGEEGAKAFFVRRVGPQSDDPS